jgi:nephrocystin-3
MADPDQAAAEVSADSREIRVFLSSTFRDFNEERRLLATQVFPRLNREARKRGVELVEVDLRWGVTQAQAEDGHALEICLKQIERCKPYFIGMLGDSYGSITPPERQLLKGSPELLAKRQWLAGRIGEASYTELEIEHSLQLLRDPAMAGKAFFYFRDPAYSKPKADAGEAGWRSDTPEDRQKLELLRQKIRGSGFPRTEGLKDPQAVVDQIEKDLWALIDQQFPEGEQPDALEKEARKHADYRRSRTGAGQYIGGEAYIQQLEQWIEAGEQQILITGESGAGKSALIANWIEAHQQNHPEDVVYAHHLGCTNDANTLRPLLARLIDTASAQLQDAEVITEALAVPEDWWELVASVSETLQSLGRWCEQKGKRWIWVLDGLDRLDPDDQIALPWLPQSLPAGVQVVASALACPARSILSERGYTTLTIEPLATAEQEQLIQRYLQRYTKELDGGLRQQILSHTLAGSPLFLKVLLEELRQCGRHDTLKQHLDFYLSSQTIDDLYERVLERLENDGSGDAVRKVMTAIWASRAGLSETELLEITELPSLQWAPIDLALEKAFGRNGNRLVFDHDFLRIAVKDRYLPTDEQQRQASEITIRPSVVDLQALAELPDLWISIDFTGSERRLPDPLIDALAALPQCRLRIGDSNAWSSVQIKNSDALARITHLQALDLSSCELDDIQLVMGLAELELLKVRPRSDLSKKLGGCSFHTPGEVAKLKLQMLGMS